MYLSRALTPLVLLLALAGPALAQEKKADDAPTLLDPQAGLSRRPTRSR